MAENVDKDETILDPLQNLDISPNEPNKELSPPTDGSIGFVMIPCDSSKPMRQIFLPPSYSNESAGDRLPDFVKPYFADRRTVDVSLMKEQAQKTIASSSKQIQSLDTQDNISAANLNAIATQGSVETFPLVRPASSNNYQGIYLYMDELGMLKKLPPNPRATAMAQECGWPPQKFYGDVFVSRVQTKPRLENVSFLLGRDTDRSTALWMQRAPHENREWHETAKAIAERTKNDFSEKKEEETTAKCDDEIAMTWEQNEEELEIRIPFPNVDDIDKSKVRVSFLSREIGIQYDNVDFLTMKPLYNSIQAGDGSCTWTIEKPNTLVITVEVSDPTVAWPQLTLS
jgi:CS domain